MKPNPTLRRGAGAGLFCVAALAALAATACSDRSQPLEPASPMAARAAAGGAQVSSGYGNVRTRFRDIARHQVPGFAGMVYDTTGQPIVFLTDPSQRGAAQAALRSILEHPRFFGSRRVPGKPTIVVRQVKHDYVQLTDWYREMVKALLGMRGLVLTSVDDARNQLQVGVSDAAAQGEAVRRVLAAGVPRGAFYVETTGLKPLSAPSTLDGTWDSIPGGTRVRNTDPVTSTTRTCTVGFNLRDSGSSDRWFATAAHCTPVFGAFSTSSPALFYHNWTSGRYLGYEAWDTAWSVNAQRYWYNPYLYGPECPSGATCRAADVAFVKYDTTRWDFGSIARPLYANAYPGGSYLTINSSSPVYRINNAEWYAMSGQTVSKVGGRTGLTTNTVVNTCSDLYWESTKVILCTQVANGNGADEGDSGAPVFLDDGNGNASLVGILIAGYPPTVNFPNASLGQIVYSPIEGIYSDLPLFSGWPQFTR
jgi:hypothetical protein